MIKCQKVFIILGLLALATSQAVFAGTKGDSSGENLVKQQIILNLLRRPAPPPAQPDPPPPPPPRLPG